MTPNPSTHAADLAVGRLARGDAGIGETAAAPSQMKERSQPGSESRAPRSGAATVEKRDERQRPRRRSAAPTTRRLGLIDCTLLALIALGVAVTVAMAIVNP